MKSESKYIFSKGDLTREDFSIKYKNEKGNFYLPIEKIKELYCFNDITISTKLLDILSKEDVVVSKIIRLAEKDIEDLNQIMPNCNKKILNNIIEEILKREDLFESKKKEFEKKLKIFREKYNV